MGEDEMTATSISMSETTTKTFVVGVYTQGLATNDQYEPFGETWVFKPLPPWQEQVVARLAELERLIPNWDGEGALPVSRRHANRANAFLARVMSPTSAAPEVVPLADGGVQLEWHLDNNARLDFITDDEEPGGVVLLEVAGELSTLTPQQAIDEVKGHLGQAVVEH
jgi:hypothetical protein